MFWIQPDCFIQHINRIPEISLFIISQSKIISRFNLKRIVIIREWKDHQKIRNALIKFIQVIDIQTSTQHKWNGSNLSIPFTGIIEVFKGFRIITRPEICLAQIGITAPVIGVIVHHIPPERKAVFPNFYPLPGQWGKYYYNQYKNSACNAPPGLYSVEFWV